VAEALSRLVTYVECRRTAVNPDDDVRILEDVAALLAQLPKAEQRRLRPLLGDALADGLGLGA
jgi:hypothetical protein